MRAAGGRAAVFAASAVIAAGAWTSASGAKQAGHDAAAPPSWQLEHTFGSCFGIINSVTATSANDAWVVGQWQPCADNQVHQVARWNGSVWQDLKLPSGFAAGGGSMAASGTAIAALSSSYSWAFVDRDFVPQSTVQSFALRWSGGKWRTFRLADGSTISSAVAFTRSDAWAFGSIPSGDGTAAYAVRYNGTQWLRVPIPVVPRAMAAPGPHDIWAIGPVPSSAVYPFPRRWALTHWNGRWHTTPLPNLNLSPGRHINGIWVVTDGAGGVWVAITEFNNGPDPYANGAVLLHWTGKRWLNVPPGFETSGLGPLAHDGHGGLWMWALPPDDSSPTLLHLSATGAWSQDPLPAAPGFLHLVVMRQIPGTDSVWAAGIEDIRDGGPQVGVTLKYGP